MGTRPEKLGDEDRLPWLETVEEEYREGPGIGRYVTLALVALAIVAAAVAAVWWFQGRGDPDGTGQLIEAQEGDYKIKPEDDAAPDFEGEGQVVYRTGEGAATNASVNLDGTPEDMVEGRKAEAPKPGVGSVGRGVEVPASGAELKAKAPERPAAKAAPAPARGGAGSVIQLGAFPSEGNANIAWARLSKRFSYLAPLGKSVERAEVNGKGVWRLRVNAGSNTQARELCGRLKVAGENCFIAN